MSKLNQTKKKVLDGLDYFSYRIEELKNDDQYYIDAFVNYIVLLEKEIKKLKK